MSRRSAVSLRVHEVKHRFQDFWALRNVSIDVEPGEFLSLLGPSGSGKTTLLRIIAGMLEPTAGKVIVGGRDITRLPPQHRNMGFVFQNYALFPHMTVFENVAFPLTLRQVRGQALRRRVAEALQLVQLSGLDHRYPAQLSGGQQQRVSLARALVFRPEVLLMDEPLGSLDKRLRQQLQIELRRLQRDIGVTTIYVTHDQEEAFSMSDRIAVMRQGSVAQVGAPPEIYRSPADPFIANFVGDMNWFEVEVADSVNGIPGVHSPERAKLRVPPAGERRPGQRVICGIRPERLRVGRELKADQMFRGTLRVLTFQTGYYRAQVDLSNGHRVLADLHEDTPAVGEGDEVFVGWDDQDALVFPA
jgi:putative spermidine/putrescine transport system ATP-binding protein